MSGFVAGKLKWDGMAAKWLDKTALKALTARLEGHKLLFPTNIGFWSEL